MALKSCVSNKFESLFGHRPTSLCSAPGRVNLIGEHIDYSGFGVLPCAISRYTTVAIGVSGKPGAKGLSIGLYGQADVPLFSLDSVEKVPAGVHHWSNYVIAAYLGLRDFGVLLPGGIELVIGGDLPQASGLSSSSSLVVACAMALASVRMSRQAISSELLAEICMKAEWYVGTAGGGMDQAAIILSKKGFASWIRFVPTLSSVSVHLPDNIVFVVANSLTASAKAECAYYRYNKRVFECKLAAFFLLENVPAEFWKTDSTATTLGEVFANLKVDPETVLEYLPENLTKSDLTENEFVKNLIRNTTWGKSVWELNDRFEIRKRALHVFSEAKRVEKFVEICQQNGDVSQLAKLMNESGRSCEEDYDCSCPELRELIGVMKSAGCLAARLTGAGWGGCAIGMVEKEKFETVLDEIYKKFFAKRNLPRKDDFLFAFEPAAGATIDKQLLP